MKALPLAIIRASYAAAAIAVAATVVSGADDWSTWRGDSALTGSSQSDIGVALKQKWQYLAEDDFVGTPVGGSDRIYAATYKGWIVALDTKGKELWKIQLTRSAVDGAKVGEDLAGSLAVSKNILVACSESGRVYGLSPKDGGIQWVYDATGSIYGSPIIRDGRIIVLAKDQGQIHCIDAKDGTKLWVSKPDARADGHPAVVGGVVVFGNCNSMLLFVNIETGKSMDAVEFGEGHEIAGAPTAAGGMIYVGTRAGSLMCVDASDRTQLWEKELGGGELFTPLTVAGDQLIVATGADKLISFSGGKQKWAYDSNGVMGAPVIAGSRVLVVADEELVVLDGGDGSKLGSVACPPTGNAPALIDGMVIVAGEDSSIYGFGK